MTDQEPKHTEGVATIAPHGKTTLVIGRRHLAASGGYFSNLPGEDAHGENEANAHRIAACWNACIGVSTEALGDGIVAKAMIDAANAEGDRTGLARELAGTLERVARDAVGIGNGENSISDATRAEVTAVLDKAKATGAIE